MSKMKTIESDYDRLEDAICAYLFECHDQTLADITSCDHDAGVCWCNYNTAHKNLLQILRRKNSSIKNSAKKQS